MTELLIPCAYNEFNRLLTPDEAERGRIYYCPECGEEVFLRHGDIRVPHFAHKSGDHCQEENLLRTIVQLLMEQTIAAWRKGDTRAPQLVRQCFACGETLEQSLDEIFPTIDGVVFDVPPPDGYPKPIDVGLFSGASLTAILEAHTNPAPPEKRLLPFLGLDGYETILNPTVWHINHDGFPPVVCGDCYTRFTAFKGKAETLAARDHLTLPDSPYRYAITPCWACQAEILVFHWQDHLHPPEPIPASLIPPRRKGVGPWQNRCPRCGAAQDDRYLFEKPHSIFYDFSLSDDRDLDQYLLAFRSGG